METATATCLHCEEEIEHLDGVGWVETQEGGHYDICTEDPEGGHLPAN